MKRLFLIVLLTGLAAPIVVGETGAKLDEYRKKAESVAADDAKGHYMLALWCETNGLDAEARLEFGKVLALDPDHAGARQSLGYVRSGEEWLSGEEAMRAKGLVRHEGEWLLPEELAVRLLPDSERERMEAEVAKARDLLRQMNRGDPKVERIAKKALEGVEDRAKVEPLAYALRYPTESVRIYAAEELGRIRDRRALRPLIHRSILDPSENVRAASVAAVRRYSDPNLLAPFVTAMWSESQPVRINAARAVEGLGDVRGIQYLVYRLRATGGGVSRNHIYLSNQLSFIQDFDVEVAQTAFIADPQVGILQEGQVLDVRVLSYERTADLVERRVVRHALSKLSGQDFGDDDAAWTKWFRENRESLASR